jgi:Protein of unknown function (DUF2796)
MNSIPSLVFLIAFLFSAQASAHTLKAHVHGNAKITIALESPTKANIALDAPGDSIFGFEHPARSAIEKKTFDAALNTLRTQGGTLIQFDPSLSCTFTVKDVGLEKEEHDSAAPAEKESGQHQDVNASYEVNCQKPITGSIGKVGIMALFPRVKKVTVEVLSEGNQFEKTFALGDNQSVQF